MGRAYPGRRSRSLGLALVAALAWTVPSTALVVSEDDYVLAADQVVDDDLVVTGDGARIAGRVRGDLVAAGDELLVEGTIEGDLLFAGRNLILKGRVADDLRAAGFGARVAEGAVVGDDAYFAGFGLEALPGSRIGGDVVVRGRQALLAGSVGGGVDAQVSALALEGPIGGSVQGAVSGGDAPRFLFLIDSALDLRDVTPGFSVADGLHVLGDLQLAAPGEPDLADEQVAGTVQIERKRRPGSEGGSVDWLTLPRRAITIALVAALLSFTGGSWLGRQAQRARREPLASLAWGAALALGVGMLAAGLGLAVGLLNAVAGAVTLGGLSPAILGVGLLLEGALLAPAGILAAYVAPAVVSVALGRLALERFQPDWLEPPWRVLVTGAVLYALAISLPWLGSALGVAGALLGLGALALGGKRLFAGETEEFKESAAAPS
jgi:hypothetical protein